ncbi:unnamed protein product [Urochloa humidicola]
MHHSKMKSREGRCGRHYLEDKATACKYEARHGEAIFWRGNFIPWFLTEENEQEIYWSICYEETALWRFFLMLALFSLPCPTVG